MRKTWIHFIDTSLKSILRIVLNYLIVDFFDTGKTNTLTMTSSFNKMGCGGCGGGGGATSHTSHRTRQYLEDAAPAFIQKDEWPPQSPNCDPMGYCMWNSLSEKVYEGGMDTFTEEELKTKIKESWGKDHPWGDSELHFLEKAITSNLQDPLITCKVD